MDNSRGLGRGLDALFNENTNASSGESDNQSELKKIPLSKIVPFKKQPRKKIKEEELKELTNSIKTHGVLEPILVRKAAGGSDTYEIIAGERRFLGAKGAGIEEIPAIVKDLNDRESIEISLVENLEREDLSPLDLALSFKSYLDEFNVTQEEFALKIGKDRATIANFIRLLELPELGKEALSSEVITQGHARALLPLKENLEIFNTTLEAVIKKSLSVRQTEELVKKIQTQKDPHQSISKEKDEEVKAVEIMLEKIFATKIKLKGTLEKGSIELSYYSREELERLVDFFRKNIDN